LLSIIDKPRLTFTNLVAIPRLKWVLPVVLSLLILVIGVWVTAPYSSELAREAAERQWQTMRLSPEQIEEFRAQAFRFNSPIAIGILGSIFGAMWLLVVWLVTSTLFYFVSIVAGVELKFGSVFVVVTWSALPLTLRSLIQTGYTTITGNFPLYPGLAALQVSGDMLKDSANPLIALLGFIDPFWIWHVILLIIGLSVVTKFSKTKSFFILLIYVLLSIGLATGRTLLGGLFAAGG